MKSIIFFNSLGIYLNFLLNISTRKQLVVTSIIVGEGKKCRHALLIGRYCIQGHCDLDLWISKSIGVFYGSFPTNHQRLRTLGTRVFSLLIGQVFSCFKVTVTLNFVLWTSKSIRVIYGSLPTNHQSLRKVATCVL